MTFERKRLVLAMLWGGLAFLVGGILAPSFGSVRAGHTMRPPNFFDRHSRSIGFVALGVFPAAAGTFAYLIMGKMRLPPLGHCKACRYDLTGNESGVCPECGTEIESP